MNTFTLRSFASTVMLASLLVFYTACQNNSSTKAPTKASTPATSTSKPAASTLAPATFRGLEVKPINFTGRVYMGIRKRVPFAQIQPFYSTNLGKIFNACQANGLAMDGMPSGLFYEYDEAAGETDMAAAIGVRSGKDLGDGIQTIRIPAGKTALQIDYYGNYKGIADAHYAMEDYINANKLSQSKTLPSIEEYITDPSTEPDPSKWLTRLVYFYGE